jgi:hypothetical protein
LLILALLAGCNSVSLPGWPKPAPETAVGAGAWTKPGADGATVASAYSDCADMAGGATEKDFDIDQDIAASRGNDLQRSDFAGAQLRDAQRSNRDRTQAILSSCMEKQGFTPAK